MSAHTRTSPTQRSCLPGLTLYYHINIYYIIYILNNITICWFSFYFLVWLLRTVPSLVRQYAGYLFCFGLIKKIGEQSYSNILPPFRCRGACAVGTNAWEGVRRSLDSLLSCRVLLLASSLHFSTKCCSAYSINFCCRSLDFSSAFINSSTNSFIHAYFLWPSRWNECHSHKSSRARAYGLNLSTAISLSSQRTHLPFALTGMLFLSVTFCRVDFLRGYFVRLTPGTSQRNPLPCTPLTFVAGPWIFHLHLSMPPLIHL